MRRRGAPVLCDVTFVIEKLTLAQSCTDMFYIEWERNHFAGLTDRQSPTDGHIIEFKKMFNCQVHLYKQLFSDSFKSKLIKFRVMRVKKGVPKKYGKFEVDVSLYYEIPVPTQKQWQLESRRRGTSSVEISILTLKTKDQQMMTIEKRMSLVKSLRKDGRGVLTEDPNGFQTTTASLSNQAKSEKYNGGNQLLSFKNSANASRNDRESENGTGNQTEDKLESFLHSKSTSDRPATEMQSKKGPGAPSKRFQTNEQCIAFFRSILDECWCSAPLVSSNCNRASSAIIAAIDYAGLLNKKMVDDELYLDLTNLFFTSFRSQRMVSKAGELDILYMFLFIIGGIRSMKDVDDMRKQMLLFRLYPLAVEQIDKYISFFLESVSDFIQKILTCESNEAYFSQFRNIVIGITDSLSPVPALRAFLINQVISSLDEMIVNNIVENPSSCRFTNSIQWRHFMSDFSSETELELPLFKETSTVIQMGASLCKDPRTKDVFAPRLPPSTVLQILAKTEPDDLYGAHYDISRFIKMFGLGANDKTERLKSRYRGDFEEITSQMAISSWIEIKYDKAQIERHPYLAEYFDASDNSESKTHYTTSQN